MQINASDNLGDMAYRLNQRDAILFQISNSVHLTMGGEDYFWIENSGAQLASCREAARTVNACILSFLNTRLKDLDDHLLDAKPAGFPRIMNWKKK